MSALANKILLKAMEPDERGRQKLVGASQIGGCPYCLGHALMQKEPPKGKVPAWVKANDDPEGLAAWIGTAVHYYLEHVIIPQVMEDEGRDLTKIVAEDKVPIYELEGYGLIQGNIDVHDDSEIVDWKIVGDWSWNQLLMESLERPDSLPRKQYRVQQHLYAYGLRQQGFDIQQVSMTVFKKSSNSWGDIEIYTENYNQNVVDAALHNLEAIWKLAKEEKFEELPQDEECYVCSRSF